MLVAQTLAFSETAVCVSDLDKAAFQIYTSQRSAHLLGIFGILASACLSDAGERSCSCTMQVMDPFLYQEDEEFQ